jgi:hypothetical protein
VDSSVSDTELGLAIAGAESRRVPGVDVDVVDGLVVLRVDNHLMQASGKATKQIRSDQPSVQVRTESAERKKTDHWQHHSSLTVHTERQVKGRLLPSLCQRKPLPSLLDRLLRLLPKDDRDRITQVGRFSVRKLLLRLMNEESVQALVRRRVVGAVRLVDLQAVVADVRRCVIRLGVRPDDRVPVADAQTLSSK